MTTQNKALPPELRAAIDRCKEELAGLCIVLRGSVTQRYVRCGKKGCRCQADPPSLHGPYYQWTRKVRGKTVTVRLKPGDVADHKAWIAASRRLDEIVAKWLETSAKAAQLLRENS